MSELWTSLPDEQTVELPDGSFAISVSSAGRHLKGMLDGRMVVHGHAGAPAAGGCGIVLDGEGVVWIHGVTVTPLDE